MLRYEETQKYDAHHDYFDPRLYAKDRNTINMIGHGKKNRMATVLWYLSDVISGGETIFPQSGGLPAPASMKSCAQGLKITPKKGKPRADI